MRSRDPSRWCAVAWSASGCGHRGGDSFEFYGTLALILIVVPLVMAVFFGLFALNRITPLVFRCRRCDREFRSAAHRPFPEVCPGCGSTDWPSAPPP